MDQAQGEPDPSPEEWETVKELLYQWETEQPKDLNAWLADKHPTNSVRREVERLVRASATSGDFLQGKAAEQHFGVAAQHPVRIGRYRVIEELGSGGLGVVYAAYDQSLERKVAIKVLVDQSGGAERRKRLRWDAKVASAAKHPNIVMIYDVGNDAGLDYVVMECVEGKQLSKLLIGGGLPAQTVLKYSLQIADALDAAHRNGIVHRDLKPNNIMITDEGEVKVLDFGLAKYGDANMEHTSLPATIEGHFAGTVAYVSPEQAEGKAVDARGDIFSFGCILFEMLTGKSAFQGASAVSILGSILHQPAPVLRRVAPQIDERFDAILDRCLQKKPEARFLNIGEVKTRLAELVETPDAPPRLSYRTRRRLLYAGLAACAAMLVAVTVLLIVFRPAPRPNSQFDQAQITTDTGLASYPAVSADGQSIAYASDRDGKGNLDIFVQHWGIDDATQITSDAADEYSPSFSPKGTEVVYRSEQDGGGLYRTSVFRGGTPILLVAQGRDGRYSPDGKWLAYWKGEIGSTLRPGCAKLFVALANGSESKEFPPGFDVAAHPVWSATDEKLIFFGRKTGQKSGAWWIADWSDGSIHQTDVLQKIFRQGGTAPLGEYYPMPRVWMANRTVFLSARRKDATNVWAVRVNPDGTVPEIPYSWTNGTDVENYPAAAVDAAGSMHLVYAALTVSSAIWRLPLTPAGKISGEGQPLITGLARIGSPSLSTDGLKMAFGAKEPGGTAIRLADLGLARPVQSTIHLDSLSRPVLSGDGGTVAWWQSNKGYMMAIKGDSPDEVCDECGQPTHLSFDGKTAIFEAGRSADIGKPSLEELLLASRGQKQRTLFHIVGAPHWLQASGRFSPDGRWVAFSGHHEGDPGKQILVVPVTPDGTVSANQVVEITHDDFANLEPVWSPDGNRIYFLSNQDGYQCVFARNVNSESVRPSGDVFPVAHFHSASRTVRGPSPNSGAVGLSAARNFLVLTLTDTAGNIWSQSNRY